MRAVLLVLVLFGLACGGAPQAVAPAPPVPVAVSPPPTPAADAFREAPPLVSDHWLNGDPIDVRAATKPVLLEVWGTWCGPCLPAGHHVQRIAEAHQDDLVVVGLAQDTAQKAGPFLKDKGWTWRNATDPGGIVSDAWGADSVPHTYLLVGGRIVWDGHPNAVEPVLDEVLAGRWTPAEAAAYAEVPAEIERYFASLGTPEAAALGGRIVDGGRGRPYELNDLAWRILTEVPEPQRDGALAVRASQTALEATHRGDYAVADTAALALWQAGRKDEARALQREASRLCAANQGNDCPDIDSRLRLFGG